MFVNRNTHHAAFEKWTKGKRASKLFDDPDSILRNDAFKDIIEMNEDDDTPTLSVIDDKEDTQINSV